MNTRPNAVRNAMIWAVVGLVCGSIAGLKEAVALSIGAAAIAYCMPPTASGTGDWSHIRHLPWSNTFYASMLFCGFVVGLSFGTDPLPDVVTGVTSMAILYPMTYWLQLKPW